MLNSVNSLNANKKVSNNNIAKSYMTSPIKGSTLTKAPVSTSLAHMNYFLGSQLVAFKGHSCKTSDFKVARLEDVPCGCCGMPMLNPKQNSELTAQITDKAGQELIDTLSANKKYFRGNESAIINYVIDQAKTDDMSSIDMIIGRSKNVDTHEIFNNEQKRVLNNVQSALLTNHVKNEKLTSLVDNNILLLNSDRNDLFNRNKFLSELNQSLKENNNQEVRHQILDKAVKLPVSEKQIERFFEKYTEEKDCKSKKIIARLLSSATVTAEHIHPHSLKGANNTANYMGECEECNSKRGNYDLNNYWMTNYPNMPESAQKNIDFVTKEIINGKMGDNYNDYPVDLKATLEKETQGQIQLKVLNPEEIEKMRKAK